jgi:transketolase
MELKHEPAVLVLTRGAVPTLDRERYASAAGLAQGAYVLADAEGGPPQVLLLGTGSEVALCVAAYEQLEQEGVRARVVSMPSWELFEKQSREYRDSVLPPSVSARVAVEAASGFGWAHYVGNEGAILAMETFGASAPLQKLLQKFGFTEEHVVDAAKEQIGRVRGVAEPVG